MSITAHARPGIARTGHSRRLRPHHFFRHEQEQSPVLFVSPAEQLAELRQRPGILAVIAPHYGARRPSLWEIGQFGRLLTIVKKLVQRDLKGASEFFQCFNGWHGMAIFDARDIATKQARPLFNFTLREFLLLPHKSQSVTDNHDWWNLQGWNTRQSITRRLTNNQDRTREAYIRR